MRWPPRWSFPNYRFGMAATPTINRVPVAEPRGVLCPPSTPKFFFYLSTIFPYQQLASMPILATLEGKCSLLKVEIWKWCNCGCRKTIVKQMLPCNLHIKTKGWRRRCRGLARLGFRVRCLKMGLRKEEERRMVRVGAGMEKLQVYREKREYIYFLLQMSGWVIALQLG